MGQVQCPKLFSLNPGAAHGGDITPARDRPSDDSTRLAEATTSALTITGTQTPPREAKQPQQFLVSGSLDNTAKLWDIDTGKAMLTLFGHIEGVWAVACNKMRLVSGSHDRTIKVSEKTVISSLFFLIRHCHVILDMESRRWAVRVDARRSYWHWCCDLPRSQRGQNFSRETMMEM